MTETITYNEFVDLYENDRISHVGYKCHRGTKKLYSLSEIEDLRQKEADVLEKFVSCFSGKADRNSGIKTTIEVLSAFRNAYGKNDGPGSGFDLHHQLDVQDLSPVDYAYYQAASLAPSKTMTRWIDVVCDNGSIKSFQVVWEPEKFLPTSGLISTPADFRP